ncbi:BnaA02g12900D [Brassica napus]|uniref:BnaA02g12900D protein n=1 Tax=Brassica napus TaxID=3708 RepID=A0A078FI45_BRANA|nr:BnaA02g12900D [Brassica napus]
MKFGSILRPPYQDIVNIGPGVKLHVVVKFSSRS